MCNDNDEAHLPARSIVQAAGPSLPKAHPTRKAPRNDPSTHYLHLSFLPLAKTTVVAIGKGMPVVPTRTPSKKKPAQTAARFHRRCVGERAACQQPKEQTCVDEETTYNHYMITVSASSDSCVAWQGKWGEHAETSQDAYATRANNSLACWSIEEA